MQIQQHRTHQAHWEKTARITVEMVVAVVPAVVVMMVEYQVMVDQETLEEQVAGQDLI
jgi:hypothetical protein